jgi:putative transposase
VLNVLDKLPKRVRLKAKRQLRNIVYSESRQEAEEKLDLFVRWCQGEGYQRASETLIRDWDRMVTFYGLPKEHWKHLRTTNVVESPLAALRLRTGAAKRYKKVENATAVNCASHSWYTPFTMLRDGLPPLAHPPHTM